MGWDRLFRNTLTFTFALVLTGSVAYAQNEEFGLAQQEYYERLDEMGRVSGDIVMGVMVGAAPKGPDDDESPVELADDNPRGTADVRALYLPPFSVGPEAEDPRLVCVRINSKNGRFEAVNTYDLGEGASVGGGVFPYLGRYETDLDDMNAVSLVKVGRCGDRTDLVVPSVWGERDQGDEDQALHVFINSAGNPTIAVPGSDPGSDPGFVECTDVSDASTLKYTAVCILRFDALEPHRRDGRVPLTFFVTRSLGEESFGIEILLPESVD